VEFRDVLETTHADTLPFAYEAVEVGKYISQGRLVVEFVESVLEVFVGLLVAAKLREGFPRVGDI
jgi:hypothetical protein